VNTSTVVSSTGLVGLLVRQLFVLAGILRARRFLATTTTPAATEYEPPVFAVVVPVLRETSIITETIGHLQAIANTHAAPLVVVTTAREDTEPTQRGRPTTAAMVGELAAAGKLTHLHYPDPAGLKADQLNHAAAHYAATLPADLPAERVFMVCYDADSRPPADSLTRFAQAITAHPQADVFHQSSRFELRHRAGTGPGRWAAALCDGGALRANRFVLGFEIPRLLNRTASTARWKRRASSYVYAHVTGHGLCIRLSAILALPLPARSPLEDMHYSFILCSRNAPMTPIASLDQAEVPDTPTGQLQQAARWFFGPARAPRYLRDPLTRRGPRAWLLAASALGSAAEWIGCALVPPLLLAAAWHTYPLGALVAAAIVAVYGTQLLLTETSLGRPDPLPRRAARVLACPIETILHGIGGILGAARLATGGTGAGKTERRQP
jgi:hypothetical protein